MLKLSLAFLLLSVLLPVDNNSRKLFEEFQLAYKQRDFNKINEIMSDDFVSYDEYGTFAFKKKDYIDQAKGWASVFNTKWNVRNIEEKGDTIVTIEDDTDMFDNYFYKGLMPFRYTYIFKNNHLISLKWDSLPGFAERMDTFNTRFNSFTSWINQNHSDDMSKLGGTDSISVSEMEKMLTEYLSIQQ